MQIRSEENVTYLSEEDSIIKRALEILEGRLARYDFTVSGPSSLKDYLKLRLRTEKHEGFWVLHLNSQHQLMAMEEMFKGTIDACAVYPRVIMEAVIKHNTAAIILAHNHPSGVAEPSKADREITERITGALDYIGVRVIDHIVVGDTCVSFAERGWV